MADPQFPPGSGSRNGEERLHNGYRFVWDANSTPPRWVMQGSAPSAPDRDRAGGDSAGGEAGPVRNKPNRPGRTNGQTVRNGGDVWQWNVQNHAWSRVRSVTNDDRRNIPTADKALDRPSGGGSGGGAGGGGNNEGGGGGGSADSPPPVQPNNAGGDGGENGSDKGGRRDELNGVPGGSKLWKVGDRHFIVYRIPDSDVPMVWEVESKGRLDRLTSNGDIKPHRVLTRDEFRETGALRFGQSRELMDGPQGRHPWVEFNDKWASMVRVMPWLKDPELMALYASSWMEEGSGPSTEDIQATDWYQNTTPEQRAAAERYGAGGNTSATWAADRQRLRDNVVLPALVEAGFDFQGNQKEVVDFFVGKVMGGEWTEQDLAAEIERRSNPYATGAAATAGIDQLPDGAKVVRYGGDSYIRFNGRDFAMNEWQESVYGRGRKIGGGEAEQAKRGAGALLASGKLGSPQGRDSVEGVEEIRGLVNEWLGPLLAKEWGESKIAQWAQRISENPDERNALVSKLRGIRASAYKGYDPELTYDDIAGVGRSLFAQVWGRTPDETSDEFQTILQMNDVGQAQAYLRQTGLKKGVRQVVNESLSGLARTVDGGVYRSAV